MDTKVLDWGQPLEAVYSDGAVEPVNCKDITKRGKDQWWVQTGPNVYLVDADTGRTADGFPTIRNVAPKEVEWGPEIKVEGKRPEWLGNGDPLEFYDFAQKRWNGVTGIDASFMDISDWWRFASAIRLPANHPHYATPTRTALEQRMEEILRDLAAANVGDLFGPFINRARVIVSKMDEDPAEEEEVTNLLQMDETTRNIVRLALRRGRTLERGE